MKQTGVRQLRLIAIPAVAFGGRRYAPENQHLILGPSRFDGPLTNHIDRDRLPGAVKSGQAAVETNNNAGLAHLASAISEMTAEP